MCRPLRSLSHLSLKGHLSLTATYAHTRRHADTHTYIPCKFKKLDSQKWIWKSQKDDTCLLYTQAYTHTHMHTHTHARTHAHTHTHTHTHTYTHTHTHTCIQATWLSEVDMKRPKGWCLFIIGLKTRWLEIKANIKNDTIESYASLKHFDVTVFPERIRETSNVFIMMHTSTISDNNN